VLGKVEQGAMTMMLSMLSQQICSENGWKSIKRSLPGRKRSAFSKKLQMPLSEEAKFVIAMLSWRLLPAAFIKAFHSSLETGDPSSHALLPSSECPSPDVKSLMKCCGCGCDRPGGRQRRRR
jgi:hypothetical protein